MEHVPEDDRLELATEATTLGELRVGDLVAGWHGLCRVTLSQPRGHGRHYAEFSGREEYGMELGAVDTPWRRVPATQTPGEAGDATAVVL